MSSKGGFRGKVHAKEANDTYVRANNIRTSHLALDGNSILMEKVPCNCATLYVQIGK